jgi:hypothetical protein
MAANPPQLPPNSSPFDAIVRDGFSRLIEFVANDPFTFVVDGERFELTTAEAILLSPIASDALKCNPMNRTFELPQGSIDPKSFRRFLDFALSRDAIRVGCDAVLSFIPACTGLGNELLALSLLSSTKVESTIGLCESGVDFCASRFYSYSVDEVRSLGSAALHRVLSSRSLSVASEDALLRLLIELDCDKSEFWCYIEAPFLSCEGIALFAESLSVDDLTEFIWEKIVLRLKGDCDDGLRDRRIWRGNLESKILDGFPDLLEDLGRKWTLLYRGSQDGFGASNFHAKCDGRANTLTVILTVKDAIMGGFTPIAWASSGGYRMDNAKTSFLFTLKNPRNIPPRKFALSKPEYAIYCGSDRSAGFGGGQDLVVFGGCNNRADSYTNFGHSYANDTGINDNEVLAGEYNFTVKEIEVFEINVAH